MSRRTTSGPGARRRPSPNHIPYQLQYPHEYGDTGPRIGTTAGTMTQTEIDHILNGSHLGRALRNLVRGTPADVSSLLASVESDNYSLVGTRATCRCHYLRLDGNGRPRLDALIERLCLHVLDYAIPRSEIEAARANPSTRHLVKLLREAEHLFAGMSTTGEGGELLLWLLTEMILGLPQIICKMSLKTSGGVHYHGIDGVHAGVDATTGALCLYWGESKFHATLSSAVESCFNDLAPFLTEPATSTSRQNRDLVLLSRHIDLNNGQLEAALKRYLDPDNPQFNSLEFRGLALVGFDCEHYPSDPNTAIQDHLNSAMATAVQSWNGRIAERIRDASLSSFVIHCFCVPVPSVEKFRALFLQGIGHTNNAAT
mgnify:FL=1